MNDELWKLSWSLISHATMPQDEVFQVAELGERKVGSKGSLHSFFADNTKPNISLLYHSYIITSIAHACNSFTCVFLDISCNEGLLGWTAPTHANRLSAIGSLEEPLDQLLWRHYLAQGHPIDHEHGRLLVQLFVIFNMIFDFLKVYVPLITSYFMDWLCLSAHACGDGNASRRFDFVTC